MAGCLEPHGFVLPFDEYEVDGDAEQSEADADAEFYGVCEAGEYHEEDTYDKECAGQGEVDADGAFEVRLGVPHPQQACDAARHA